MSRVGQDDVLRFLSLDGRVCYLDTSSVEFFTCVLVGGVIIEQDVENYIVGSLYWAVEVWSDWRQKYPTETRLDWARYILQVLVITLGSRIRCILAGEINVCRFFINRLMREFTTPNRLTTTLDGINRSIGLDLIDSVSERRMFLNLIGDPVYTRGLYLRLDLNDPDFELVATCYEWFGWSDILFLLGRLLKSYASYNLSSYILKCLPYA